MIYSEGNRNPECIKKLLAPVKHAISSKVNYETFDERKKLWNEIDINYTKYISQECGSFLSDLNTVYESEFTIGLLSLAVTFQNDKEIFEPPKLRFSTIEIESFKKVNKYSVLDILEVQDIKKRVISRNKDILNLFKEYYLEMGVWIETVLHNNEINVTVRSGIKRIWEKHNKKLNTAMTELNQEYDWFKEMLIEWKTETESHLNIKHNLEKDEIIRNANKKIKEKELEVKEIKEDFSKKEQDLNDRILELKKMKQNLEEGSRYVNTGSARQYEMNFIDRIERKFSGEIEISGKKFKLASKTLEAKTDKIPKNESLKIELIEKGINPFKKKKNFIFLSKYVSRIEKYSKYGFDTDPLGLEEINEHISDSRDLAKNNNKPAIICISSPTGFENSVKKHFWSENFHKNFLSGFLSIFLLDLETGELIYNKNDSLANEFKKFAEIEIDIEKIEKVKLEIKKRLKDKSYVSVDELLNIEEEYIVKPAVYSIADEENLKVQNINDVGLTLFE